MLDELIAKPNALIENAAGGYAYRLDDKLALAQFALTGTMGDTYYAFWDHTDDDLIYAQLKHLVWRANDTEFLAKLTLYARKHGQMKDTPAALWLLLCRRDPELAHQIFMQIFDTGRMLRTLFQLIRSGELGRTSLSSSLQRAFQRWLNTVPVHTLLSASIGESPSLRDILRLSRPRPPDNQRRALFGWILGRKPEKWAPATWDDLPQEVILLDRFRNASTDSEQIEILEKLNVRWDLLADSALSPFVWRKIAQKMSHQTLRMNVNTLQRQGVFKRQYDSDGPNVTKMIDYVAGRLKNVKEIRRSRQFPYRYLEAYQSMDFEVSSRIRSALNEAAAISCENTPRLPGPVVICVDTSWSMFWPVTGFKIQRSYDLLFNESFLSALSKCSSSRCIDVAGVLGAALFTRNKKSVVVPFDDCACEIIEKRLSKETFAHFASRLTKIGYGGTSCSSPLKIINDTIPERAFSGCIMISDNESWCDREESKTQTAMLTEWKRFVQNQKHIAQNAQPKLVCLNVQSHVITQALERSDVLNIGGFGEEVFKLIGRFFNNEPLGTLLETIESVEL